MFLPTLTTAVVLILCCGSIIEAAPGSPSTRTKLVQHRVNDGWNMLAEYNMDPNLFNLVVEELKMIVLNFPRPFNYEYVGQHLISRLQVIFQEPPGSTPDWIVVKGDPDVEFKDGYFGEVKISKFGPGLDEALHVTFYRPLPPADIEFTWSGVSGMDSNLYSLVVEEIKLIVLNFPRPFNYEAIAAHLIPKLQAIFQEPAGSTPDWIVVQGEKNVNFEPGYYGTIQIEALRPGPEGTLRLTFYRPRL